MNSPFPLFSSAPFLVPPGRGELEFHYTALSFTAPEKNRFKYRLEGLDSDWVDAGARHTAFYNNVPPGDYTFRVRGCNNDGVWNALGANVKLSLQPHYWQTWWFKLFVALAGLSLAAAAARYTKAARWTPLFCKKTNVFNGFPHEIVFYPAVSVICHAATPATSNATPRTTARHRT